MPRSSRVQLAVIGTCLAFGLAAPATRVSPSETGADTIRVLEAVGLTVLGVAGACLTGALAFRRTRNYSWLIIAFIPSFSLLAGAAVLAAVTSGG
ncbi:MAG: hypothetical protein ACRC35_10515 [Angustibacter sp.]